MQKEECVYESEHEETIQKAIKNMPDEGGISALAGIFKVLGEPSRLKIILALMEGELCVYHIVEACGGNQSAVSHQLRVLRDNRVIKSRRDGQNILYSIADDHIKSIIKMSESHLYCKIENQ